MSIAKPLIITTLSLIGSYLVNVLTPQGSGRILGIPVVPVVLGALAIVALLTALVQIEPRNRSSETTILLAELKLHRDALQLLKQGCLAGKRWDARCVDEWNDHQRHIQVIKNTLIAARVPFAENPIDVEPAKLGCAIRLALFMRHTATLLAIPFVVFTASTIALRLPSWEVASPRPIARITPTTQVIASLITPAATRMSDLATKVPEPTMAAKPTKIRPASGGMATVTRFATASGPHTPAPATQTPIPSAEIPTSLTPKPATAVRPSPTSGVSVTVGRRVRVSLLSTQVLTVRSAPGRTATAIAKVPTGTLFTVVDGPVEADRLVWWHLENDRVKGWAAEGDGTSRWLTVVEP